MGQPEKFTDRRFVWRRRLVTVVAGVVALLVGVDPASAGPMTAQIVRTAVSTIAESRQENWEEAQVDLPDTLEAHELPDSVPAVLESVDVPQDSSGSQTSSRLLAADSGVAGQAGSWTATPFGRTGSWSAGGNAGAFSSSYPIGVPSVSSGPVPSLSLNYSSASTDGRVAGENNQTSGVGEGWDVTQGYVEKQYTPCSQDTDPVNGKAPNNVGHETGDLCQDADNAVLVLNGSSKELVKDTGTGTWRPKNDDGTRVEHLTGAGNGDQKRDSAGAAVSEGEYWKVTTPDGVQYFFGQDKRPEDDEQMYSAWTVPVYGNHPGEQCYVAGNFAGSRCTQVWRWNLDRVIDPLGGTMSYFYAREWQRYGYNGDTGTVSYVRGGHLARIEYGSRLGAETPSAQISFTLSGRCLEASGLCADADRSANPNRWPDVPSHLECQSTSSCPDLLSPVFFSVKRISKITTQARATTGSLVTVDEYALRHQWVDPHDGSLGELGAGKILWLAGITRTARGDGDTTDSITLPEVQFAYEMLPNRVDSIGDGAPEMFRPRMLSVRSETGALTSISYAPATCTAGNIPTSTASEAVQAGEGNRRRCFPIKWHNDEYALFEPVERIDWFHKYVVASIHDDGNGPAGVSAVQTSYQYDTDGPVWVEPTGPLVKADEVTFSQYRGFATATTITGDGGDGPRTKATTTYFQGIDGKALSAHGISATDREHFYGTALATTVYDGSTPVSAVVSVPTRSSATATGSDGTTARRVESMTQHEFTFTKAGNSEAHTREITHYDDYGQVHLIDDNGDVDTTADDQCTRVTFARNTTAYLVSTGSRSETVSRDCDQSPVRPDDVISDIRTYYDNHTGLGDAPSKGLPTKTEQLDPRDGVGYVPTGTVAYDAQGRPVSATNAAGAVTKTGYTENSAGRLNKVTTTSPDPDGTGPLSAHVTTSEHHPLLGAVVATTDANGKKTTGSYDDLGRLLQVTYPQHAGTGGPSATHAYTIGQKQVDGRTVGTGLLATVTGVRGAEGTTMHYSSTIYDGLGRQIQTQTEAADAGDSDTATAARRGRVITHTVYDSAGRVSEVAGPWHAGASVVSTTPLAKPVLGTGDTLAYTTTTYDGASRPVAEAFWTGTTSNPEHEEWRTVTRYDGLYTTVVPPVGGTATTTVNDARGRTTSLWQHKARPSLTGFDPRTLGASTYQATTYSYDHAGQLARTSDPDGNDWIYKYDWAGRQVSATDPDAGTTQTTYNTLGQIEKVTNGAGQTLGYTYDALGRRTSVRDASPTGAVRASWTYDKYTSGPYAGEAVKGLTTASTRVDGGLKYTTSIDEVNDAYQPLSTTLQLPTTSALGALSGKSFTAGYQYMTDGQLAQVTHPAAGQLGPETVTNYYDSASMPSWSGGGFGWGVYVANTRFSAFGETSKIDLGNTYGATATYQYEAGTRRLKNIGLYREDITGTEVNLTYAYDDAGNIRSQSDRPSAAHMATKHDTQCYTYDGLRRLTRAWTPNTDSCTGTPSTSAMGGVAPYWTDWKHDPIGNRTQQTEHAKDGTTTTTNYTHGNGIQVDGAGPHAVTTMTTTTETAGGTSTTTGADYVYDTAGRMTDRGRAGQTTSDDLAWDAESELATITAGGTARRFVYDADGNRLVRFQGTTHAYVTIPGGTELKLTLSSGTVEATRYYTFAGQTVAARTGTGLGGVTSLVSDHQGTVVAQVPNTNPTTTAVKRRYTDPYGQFRAGYWAPGARNGFLGEVRDGTGLTMLGARYYDEHLGRFISVDPIMDLTDPQQWSAYAYANNNPVTWSDPSGLRPIGAGHTGVTVGYGPDAEMTPTEVAKAVSYTQTATTAGPKPDLCSLLLLCSGTEEPINYPTALDDFDAAADRKILETIDGLAAFVGQYWECALDPLRATGACDAYYSTLGGMPQATVEGTASDVQEIGDAFATGHNAEGAGLASVFIIGVVSIKGTGRGAGATADAAAASKVGASMGFDNLMTSFRKLRPGRNPKNKYVKTVGSNDELQDVFNSWTAGAERVTPQGDKVSDAFQLADGSRIQWRTSSKSGGATIEVLPMAGRERKVHINGG